MKSFMAIFAIIEREGKKTEDGKPVKFWNRIGTAWQNKDGSYNLQFDTFPVGGANIQMRVPAEKEEGFGS